ncbi:MAG: S8 family serine peptidase [Candidatus Krumholzibacteriota bacterium]
MLRRFAPIVCLSALVGISLIAASAHAVEIHQELQALLQAKSATDRVPVLMLFDDPVGVDDIRSRLEDVSHQERRRLVLENLRSKADRKQAGILGFLADPVRGKGVGRVRTLYLANALAFEAAPDVIKAMGALPDEATLFFDKNYDLISGTSRGSAPAAPLSPAAADTAWSVKYINAHEVWSRMGYTGAGVIVGHIDTGIYLTHPDLASRLWVNPGEVPGNGVDDDGNGFIDDVNGWDFGDGDNDPNDDSLDPGHGTHTAGTVAGDGTGGTLTGVAPGATLMAGKVWQANGSGGSLAMIWAAEQYCVENGARILTMSLGIPGDIPPYFMRNERLNNNNIRDAGVIFFNSAGNEHFSSTPPLELTLTARVPPPWLPAGYPHSSSSGIITVGGTGYKNDNIYSYSSRGPAHWGNVDPWNDWPYLPGPGIIKPDVAMPGTWVNSTVIPSGYSGDTWSGTSMACPHAAGLAALMLEKNPTLSPAGVDSVMEQWAIDLGSPGKDNDFGSGRPDALTVVAATPMIQAPDITWTELYADPTGDGVLDPGEVSEVAFQLMNTSPLVGASAVSGVLSVKSNAYVSVADGTGTFTGIPAAGGLGDNLDSPFSLDVDPAAPQGYEFTLLLTVTADLHFQKTFDISGRVGLPDFRTHEIGDVYLTVTDQGIIGYMDQGGGEGVGMGPAGFPSDLFVSSFWAGTSASYICNRDYNGLGSENYEWVVSDPDPNGRVRDLGPVGSDQTFQAIFTDGGHASPLPLEVEQLTMAFETAPYNNFVILEYHLTNNSAAAVPALYTGVYCDFDIGEDSTANMGGTDALRNMTYLYEPLGHYYGIVLLGGEVPQNLTVVNNIFYVFPTSAITDANKFDLLTGTLTHPVGKTNDDWSALTSSVMSLDAGGGQGVAAYALVFGNNLTELRENADAAIAVYDPIASLTEKTPVKLFRLGQNHPNPFNPTTSIRFTLDQEGPVELAVFDVGGRKIRTLLRDNRSAGDHEVTWNGTDDSGSRVPSGMYFYQLSMGHDAETRKMLLLK